EWLRPPLASRDGPPAGALPPNWRSVGSGEPFPAWRGAAGSDSAVLAAGESDVRLVAVGPAGQQDGSRGSDESFPEWRGKAGSESAAPAAEEGDVRLVAIAAARQRD